MVGDWDVNRARLGWWGLGAVLAAAVLFVTYSFVGTFVFGIFIYYATRPLYRRLRRRVKPPSVAAATALFTLALPVLLLATYTGAIGLQELNKAVKRLRETGSIPADANVVWSQIQPYVNASSVAQRPEELLANPSADLVREVGLSALQYLGLVGTGLLHLFVMIAIAFYLLRDDHRFSRYVLHQFADDGGVLDAYVRAVDRDFNSIFFGNILNALITGTIGAAAYNLLNYFGPAGFGVPYPTLVGLIAGAASLIPIVGMKLVYFPISAYLGVELAVSEPSSLWFAALFFVVSLVLVDTIPDLVLRPYVSGRDLHVGLVMLAYILGPLLFGWYGIFLGPMILVLVVHFVRIVLPELVRGEAIRPWAVDPTYLFESGGRVGEPAGSASHEEATDGAGTGRVDYEERTDVANSEGGRDVADSEGGRDVADSEGGRDSDGGTGVVDSEERAERGE